MRYEIETRSLPRGKKTLAAMICVFFVFSMTACSEQPSEISEHTSTPPAISESVVSSTAPESAASSAQTSEVEISDNKEEKTMKITVGDTVFTASFADNSSAEALKDMLSEAPLTIEMHDYGNFEKVGTLGVTLPRNDEQITTVPGDIILYQGNSLTIYYDENSWSFTKIGHIDNATPAELKAALGSGDVTVTFSLD